MLSSGPTTSISPPNNCHVLGFLSAASQARRECLDQPDFSCSHPRGCAQKVKGCRYISFLDSGLYKSLFLSPRDFSSGPSPSPKTVLSLSTSSPHQPMLRPHSAHCLGPCPSPRVPSHPGLPRTKGFPGYKAFYVHTGTVGCPFSSLSICRNHQEPPPSEALLPSYSLLSTRKAPLTTILLTSSSQG